MLTMSSMLAIDDPLREMLGDMSLFNFLCGEDNITGDIDYKHILKRLCNKLLRLKCMTLDSVTLTVRLIKLELMKAGIKDESAINAFLSPKDKQDVNLMYDLLTSIATLPPPSSDDNAGQQNT